MNTKALTTLRLTSLTLALTLASVAAFAAAQAVVPAPIVDVGTVAQGEDIEHDFVLRNDGDTELTVREVKPACGCTVTSYDETIAPGASGTITAVLDTRNFSGPIAKSVAVFTSDSKNPEIRLVIKAIIQPAVEVRPGYARFIVVEGRGTESTDQTLWTASGPELEIRSVRSPYPFVKASYARIKAEKGGERARWRVRLALDRDSAPVGPLADFVEVQTNHPEQPVIKIPVSGFVRPELSVTPRVAELGSHELDAPYSTVFEVRNQTEAAITVESVSADVAGVETEIEEIEEGKVYKVVLTLTPDMAKGPFSGKVQISTTSKRRPTLEVDLSGTVL